MIGRSLPRVVLQVAAVGLFAVALAGLLNRVTFRDTLPRLDVAYYALQLPVLAGLLGLAGLAWLAAGRRRPALIAGLVCAALLVAWVPRAVGFHACPPAADDGIEMMFWNVARGRGGWHGIIEAIRQADADVVGLVETTGRSWTLPWQTELPGYRYTSLGRGLAILTRGEVLNSLYHPFTTGSHAMELELRIDGRQFRLILVDLQVSLRLRRGYLIERVTRLVERPSPYPTIVMGDFNTPTDSVTLAELRRSYRNALEVAGRGLRVTWPRWLPVLAIDQIWVGPEVEIRCTRTDFNALSDHAQVRMTLD